MGHVKEKLGEMKCLDRHYCEDKMAVENTEGDLVREAEKCLARKELLQVGPVEEAIAVLPRRGLKNSDPGRHDLACEAYSLARGDF